MRKIIPGLLAATFCMFASDAAARFVSVDPVQPNPNTGQNFNRYVYANGNPYRYIDPDGRYVCKASGEGQCGRLEKAVTQIHSAAERAPAGSPVKQVSEFLGAPGTDNGVVISDRLVDKRNLGEATSLDGTGVHIGLNFDALKGTDKLSSVAIHEGSHGVDHRKPDFVDRLRAKSKSALEVSEHAAGTAQGRMYEALGRNEPFKLYTVDGGMDWEKINEPMQRSVD